MTYSKQLTYYFILSAILFASLEVVGQQNRISPGLLSDDLGKRLDIMHRTDDNWHTDIRPWTRKDVTRRALYADSLGTSQPLTYIFDDNTEWLGYSTVELKNALTDNNSDLKHLRLSKKPILKKLYKTPANFLEVNEKDFYLRINPLLDFDVLPSFEDDGTYFNNRRGLELRGGLDGKIYFYTNVIESQSRFADYVEDYIEENKAVPGAGFYKDLNKNIIGGNSGHDYLLSEGYIGLQATKHFGLELGHGRHFIGNGIRSLLLSDFANNYFYLSFNTKIWKLQYKNIFAEMSPNTPRDKSGDELLVKKYYVAHYLSFNIGKNANFGFFESVSFARPNQFEFQYLNPAILYRTVEQGLGSPDNVLIGFNGHINILKRVKLYGQLVMDELNIDQLSESWWANKFGFQAGLTYVDPIGLKNAELTLEGNLVRPFTYAHRDTISNFTHSKQALAHPTGANFAEGIVDFVYRPSEKWRVSWRTHILIYGEDNPPGEFPGSLGNNILRSTDSRPGDFGHEFLQGVQSNTILSNIEVSYQIRHNVFIDLLATYRDQNSEFDPWDLTTFYGGLGLRMNMGRRVNAF